MYGLLPNCWEGATLAGGASGGLFVVVGVGSSELEQPAMLRPANSKPIDNPSCHFQ